MAAVAAAKRSSVEEDLEALEKLARRLSSAEAERIAALECAEILQRRLANAGSPSKADAVSARAEATLRSRWHRCAAWTPIASGKENECPRGMPLQDTKTSRPGQPQAWQHEPLSAPTAVVACLRATRADGAAGAAFRAPPLPSRWGPASPAPAAILPGPPLGEVDAVSKESHLQSELNATSRQAGFLRAKCAQHREGSSRLKAELRHADRLLAGHTARASVLRAQLRMLQDDERRDAGPGDVGLTSNGGHCSAPRHEPSQFPCALQSAHAAFRERSVELERLDCVAAKIRACEAIQERSLEEDRSLVEQELRAWQRAETHAAESAREDVGLLESKLANEGISVRGLRLAKCGYTTRVGALQVGAPGSLNSVKGFIPVPGADVLSSGFVSASQSELRAQRSAMYAMQVQRDTASAELAASLRASAIAASALAVDEATFRARSEWLHVGLDLEASAAAELREQVEGETRLYRRLAGRLRLKDQWVSRLRKERVQWKEQQRLLLEVEGRIAALVSEHEKSEADLASANLGAAATAECSRVNLRGGSDTEARRAISEAEAARILSATLELLQRPHANEGSVCIRSASASSGAGDFTTDLSFVASSTEAAAKQLREELRFLLVEVIGAVAALALDDSEIAAAAKAAGALLEMQQQSVNVLLKPLPACLRGLSRSLASVRSRHYPNLPAEAGHSAVAGTPSYDGDSRDRLSRILDTPPPNEFRGTTQDVVHATGRELQVTDVRSDVDSPSRSNPRKAPYTEMHLSVPRLGSATPYRPASACAPLRTPEKTLDGFAASKNAEFSVSSPSTPQLSSTADSLAGTPPWPTSNTPSLSHLAMAMHPSAIQSLPRHDGDACLRVEVKGAGALVVAGGGGDVQMRRRASGPSIAAPLRAILSLDAVSSVQGHPASQALAPEKTLATALSAAAAAEEPLLMRQAVAPPRPLQALASASYPESLAASPAAPEQESRVAAAFCEPLAAPPPLPSLGGQRRAQRRRRHGRRRRPTGRLGSATSPRR